MRYFAGYIYGGGHTDGGGGPIGVYDSSADAICAAWEWLYDSSSTYGLPSGDDYRRADVYAYGGESDDPDYIWDTLPPLYTGEDGDVCHMLHDARGITYTTCAGCD